MPLLLCPKAEAQVSPGTRHALCAPAADSQQKDVAASPAPASPGPCRRARPRKDKGLAPYTWQACHPGGGVHVHDPGSACGSCHLDKRLCSCDCPVVAETMCPYSRTSSDEAALDRGRQLTRASCRTAAPRAPAEALAMSLKGGAFKACLTTPTPGLRGAHLLIGRVRYVQHSAASRHCPHSSLGQAPAEGRSHLGAHGIAHLGVPAAQDV